MLKLQGCKADRGRAHKGHAMRPGRCFCTALYRSARHKASGRLASICCTTAFHTYLPSISCTRPVCHGRRLHHATLWQLEKHTAACSPEADTLIQGESQHLLAITTVCTMPLLGSQERPTLACPLSPNLLQKRGRQPGRVPASHCCIVAFYIMPFLVGIKRHVAARAPLTTS